MCDKFPPNNFYHFGFLLKRSTLQQLLLFVKHVLEPKCEVDVVYIDFRKAFDTVSHDRLLQKLKVAGISGTIWRWFQAYLKQRYQCVEVGDLLSKLCNVLSGVPWASVLGPYHYCLLLSSMICLSTLNLQSPLSLLMTLVFL